MRTKDLVIALLVVVAVSWAARLGWDIYKEVQARHQQQPGSHPRQTDLQIALGIFFGMTVAQLLFRQFYSVFARAMIPKKPRWSNAVWDAKIARCCEAIFKFIYYSAMTVWGVILLRDSPWVPRVLGGSGDTRFCWTDYPFQLVPDELRRFYLTSLGFHFSELAVTFLEIRKPDFWEVLLHHSVTCSLVSYSYVLNYLRLGSLVLMLHAVTDVFIYLSKTFVDTPWNRATAISYLCLALNYAWFRVYVFPVYLIRSAWVESLEQAGAQHVFAWGYMNFAMCLLFVLHIYWFGLILKSGVVFKRTGHVKDLQSNLSSMDLDKKKKR